MSPSSGNTNTAASSSSSHQSTSNSEQVGRPRAGSESSGGRGPVSKVMDIFRHRSHSAVSAEDKRKAVCICLFTFYISILCFYF